MPGRRLNSCMALCGVVPFLVGRWACLRDVLLIPLSLGDTFMLLCVAVQGSSKQTSSPYGGVSTIGIELLLSCICLDMLHRTCCCVASASK